MKSEIQYFLVVVLLGLSQAESLAASRPKLENEDILSRPKRYVESESVSDKSTQNSDLLLKRGTEYNHSPIAHEGFNGIIPQLKNSLMKKVLHKENRDFMNTRHHRIHSNDNIERSQQYTENHDVVSGDFVRSLCKRNGPLAKRWSSLCEIANGNQLQKKVWGGGGFIPGTVNVRSEEGQKESDRRTNKLSGIFHKREHTQRAWGGGGF